MAHKWIYQSRVLLARTGFLKVDILIDRIGFIIIGFLTLDFSKSISLQIALNLLLSDFLHWISQSRSLYRSHRIYYYWISYIYTRSLINDSTHKEWIIESSHGHQHTRRIDYAYSTYCFESLPDTSNRADTRGLLTGICPSSPLLLVYLVQPRRRPTWPTVTSSTSQGLQDVVY